MLFSLGFVLTEVTALLVRSGRCYYGVQALLNVNELDVTVNGFAGGCCYCDGYLCSVLSFDVFS